MDEKISLPMQFKKLLNAGGNSYSLFEKLISVYLFDSFFHKVDPCTKFDLGLKNKLESDIFVYYFTDEINEVRRHAVINLMKEIILVYNAFSRYPFVRENDLTDFTKNSLFFRLLQIMLSKDILVKFEFADNAEHNLSCDITVINLKPGLNERSKYYVEVFDNTVKIFKEKRDNQYFNSVDLKLDYNKKLSKNEVLAFFKQLINKLYVLESKMVECKVCKHSFQKIKNTKHYTCNSCKKIMQVIARDKKIKFSQISDVFKRKREIKKNPKTDKEIFLDLYKTISNNSAKLLVKKELKDKYRDDLDFINELT